MKVLTKRYCCWCVSDSAMQTDIHPPLMVSGDSLMVPSCKVVVVMLFVASGFQSLYGEK